MNIEGYIELEESLHTFEVRVFISTDVAGYFAKEGQKGRRNTKHVKKVKNVLRTLKLHGLDRVKESPFFKREGTFPSGRKTGGNQVVYEAKSDQVRVYGGSVTISNQTVFYFTEATTKQQNRADQKQLQRVAKALGKIQDVATK